METVPRGLAGVMVDDTQISRKSMVGKASCAMRGYPIEQLVRAVRSWTPRPWWSTAQSFRRGG